MTDRYARPCFQWCVYCILIRKSSLPNSNQTRYPIGHGTVYLEQLCQVRTEMICMQVCQAWNVSVTQFRVGPVRPNELSYLDHYSSTENILACTTCLHSNMTPTNMKYTTGENMQLENKCLDICISGAFDLFVWSCESLLKIATSVS